MLVDVAVPFRVAKTFHYQVDDELGAQLQLGSLIQVPFKTQSTHAFVLGFPQTTTFALSRLKRVESLLFDEPLFDDRLLKFLQWISEYYCHPIGEVIEAAISRQYWKGTGKKAKKASRETIVAQEVKRPTLNEEQQFAVARLLDTEEKRPFLLHGVTGSGKTEIYMHVLEKTLAEGKGGIVLAPEIALTPQLLGRFAGRFPGKVAILHSELTPRERQEQWKRVRSGEARIVVGARSAIFAPVRDLGCLIVDEEHEPSFKQEDSLRYHARDLAIMRGHLEGARVILGSATPSIESYYHAQGGKYAYITLKNRVENRPMPTTHFVNLRAPEEKTDFSSPWLTQTLRTKMWETLAKKEQILLYLNRLGFAHFLYCRDCGETWRCRACDVALTYYKSPPGLKCHYCGAHRRVPSQCDHCKGISLETLGAGTEQVEQVLKVQFPRARIGRLDRASVKTRGELEATLTAVQNREIDILIGTQMVTKGHDFPGITLVGILMADASLNLPDFRANERTFQILTQVSGRAGRADQPGTVVVQTINPEHPVLRAAAEYRTVDFYRDELSLRRRAAFTPYVRMAMLRFQHRNPEKVAAYAQEITTLLRRIIPANNPNAVVLGPAEAPIAKLKNLVRWQCLLKADSVRTLQSLLGQILAHDAQKKHSVQLAVDVDPIHAL